MSLNLAKNHLKIQETPDGSAFELIINGTETRRTVNHVAPLFNEKTIQAFISDPKRKGIYDATTTENTPEEKYFFESVLNCLPFKSDTPSDGSNVIFYSLELQDFNGQKLPGLPPDEGAERLSVIERNFGSKPVYAQIQSTRKPLRAERYMMLFNHLNQPALAGFKALPNYRQRGLRLIKAVSWRMFCREASDETEVERRTILRELENTGINQPYRSRNLNNLPYRRRPADLPDGVVWHYRKLLYSADAVIFEFWMNYVVNEIVRLLYDANLKETQCLGLSQAQQTCQAILLQRRYLSRFDRQAEERSFLAQVSGYLAHSYDTVLAEMIAFINGDEKTFVVLGQTQRLMYEIMVFYLVLLPGFDCAPQSDGTCWFCQKLDHTILRDFHRPTDRMVDGEALFQESIKEAINLGEETDFDFGEEDL